VYYSDITYRLPCLMLLDITNCWKPQ